MFQAQAAVTCACLTEWTWEPSQDVPRGDPKKCGKAMGEEGHGSGKSWQMFQGFYHIKLAALAEKSGWRTFQGLFAMFWRSVLSIALLLCFKCFIKVL